MISEEGRQSWRARAPRLQSVGKALVACVILAELFVVSAPAVADEQADLRRGKVLFKNKGNCVRCHGWSGNGVGHPRAPGAPSLRDTRLELEDIIYTIKCGRPGTEMPYHDRHAYSDDRCYGMTKAEMGDDMPKRAKKPLRDKEIKVLAYYLSKMVIGRGAITFEECEAYFGKGAKYCGHYKK